VEARGAHPVLKQPLEVNVGGDHLFVVGEAFGLGQQVAVFVNQSVPIQARSVVDSPGPAAEYM